MIGGTTNDQYTMHYFKVEVFGAVSYISSARSTPLLREVNIHSKKYFIFFFLSNLLKIIKVRRLP